MLGQLLRAITYRDKHTFIKLFKMYVRSQLEYCEPAWSPWLQKDKDLLEKVQQQAVNAVFGLTGSYHDKLFQLLSLADMRSRGDMIQTYKIVNKVDNADPYKFVSLSACSIAMLPGQQLQLQAMKLYHSQDSPGVNVSLNNFLSQHIVEPWNAFPAQAHRTSSVDELRMKYDDPYWTGK